MPYRNMTIEELAKHLALDVREARRMAQAGRIPGQFVAGQWRFNRAQLHEWLQREMHGLPPEQIDRIERAMTDRHGEPVIGEYLTPQGIDMNLPARSKSSVLRELVRLAERTDLIYDPAALLAAVLEREELCSTGLAGGVAWPHARRPLPTASEEPLICLARVPAGIPFGAPDGKLTDLFFLIISHDERWHLHILARLALMQTTDLPAKLRAAETSEEALAGVLETELELLRSRV
ncbi:MAG: PTS sugar transporter subunit IIA [Phycisphaerales bacterium]|nr:PTS sugar transporter subunit IIA [Phycisphaerales bacterium]